VRNHPGAFREIVMELNMKVGLGYAALFAMAAASISPAHATCLNVKQIRDTKVADVSTIYFEMKNRKVYRNALPVACNQLKFSAFGWHARSGQVCDKQAIRLDRGGSCMLGKFEPVQQ